jgi:hypothetical protein
MYDERTFRLVANTEGGDSDGRTSFRYHQRGDVVWATYEGGAVRFGTLVAKVNAAGDLDMIYQHVAADMTFRSGRCLSRCERLADGRIRLHERWVWTSGAEGSGTSVIEEVALR